jgi:hypothetical protein
VGGERPETFGEVERIEAGDREGREGRRPVGRFVEDGWSKEGL